jgi:hypothetical protein
MRLLNEMLIDMVHGRKPTRTSIESLLVRICDDTHAECDSHCPVFEINGGDAPNEKGSEAECDCFKNGKAMYDFIKRFTG